MVSRERESSRSLKFGGIAGAKRTIEKVKREEGADRFQFHSALGRGREVENEKKTNAHHV